MTTMAEGPSAGVFSTARVRRFESLRILRSAASTGRGRFGLALTLFVVAVAVIGPFFAPDNPNAAGVTATFAAPSPGHLLGGDVLGRDVLSRMLTGGWMLLALALASTALGVVLGTIAGMAAAYRPGWRDGAMMRTVDVLLAFPQLVFALLLLSVLGNHLYLVVLAVGLSHAPQVARVIRASALEISERDYIKAVQVMGVRGSTVMRREILPNLVSPLMVETGLRMTYSIIIMAGLAFLGFGFQPPDATWGYMIRENQIGMLSNPWGVVAPAALLAVLAIGFNTFTDAVARVAIGVDRAEVVGVIEATGGSEVEAR
jgi:peptide/nickel transport system permease protein